MKKFWPHRSEANGFSIKKLAHKYRLKISSLTTPTNEISDQILVKNTKSSERERENISFLNSPIKILHWANRDFSEYKRTA